MFGCPKLSYLWLLQKPFVSAYLNISNLLMCNISRTKLVSWIHFYLPMDLLRAAIQLCLNPFLLEVMQQLPPYSIKRAAWALGSCYVCVREQIRVYYGKKLEQLHIFYFPFGMFILILQHFNMPNYLGA